MTAVLPDIRSLAPLRINSTVLPIADLQVSPDIASEAFRHSGNEFPSALTQPGAAPRLRWKTPAKTAIDLIGLKALKATVLDIHFAKFVDAIRSASSVHTKIALATNCLASVFIRRFAVQDRGVAWADCEAILLSNDGMTHPMAAPTSVALPTLASQPSLHTLGTTELNGNIYGGAKGFSCDLNPDMMVGLDGSPGDGLLYPMAATYRGGSPIIEVDHADPVGLMAALSQIGVAIGVSTFKQWLRDYDSTNHVALTTGVSLTVASGRANPVEYAADSGRQTRGGLRIEALSTGTSHPVVVATGTVAVLV
jgi:hypothetical protein